MLDLDNIQSLSLYHYRSCPFCVMTTQAIDQTQLDIERRDIQLESKHYQALLNGGGSTQVPCLLIEMSNGENHWLFESMDIIAFVQKYSAHQQSSSK